MQTAMHPAFEAKLAVLAALLERSQVVRDEARAKVEKGSPRYQASGHGGTWDVVEIATGDVKGFAYSYRTALRFVDAMEAGAASKQGPCNEHCHEPRPTRRRTGPAECEHR